jgi:anaerobic C4-dicarboxylate transporter
MLKGIKSRFIKKSKTGNSPDVEDMEKNSGNKVTYSNKTKITKKKLAVTIFVVCIVAVAVIATGWFIRNKISQGSGTPSAEQQLLNDYKPTSTEIFRYEITE